MKRDRIENAIRHIQTAVDIDPWARDLAVEALKAQLSEEDTTSDCISRQAAIDALGHMMDTDGFRDGWAVSRANVDCMLRALPSVQPEPDHFRETRKMIWHKCDPDDPSSFPDDGRPVLVSFPDSPIPAVGWFERNYDFFGWTDGELFGLHADGWWELPKKPERRIDGSD